MRLPADSARFDATPLDGVTLMHAHFREHSFDRHSHETFGLGVTFGGTQVFRCRGSTHASRRDHVLTFNPDEAHDGHGGDPGGFRYAILYIEPARLAEWCADGAQPGGGRFFRQPLVHDPRGAARVAAVIDAMSQPGEALRAHALASETVSWLMRRHGADGAASSRTPSAPWLDGVRDWLEARYRDDVRIDDLAAIAGVTRVHVTRAFTRRYGTPPHVMLNAIRLRHAMRALRAGGTIVEAALDSGFADQSHFSRRFKGAVGLSPAAWRAQQRASGSNISAPTASEDVEPRSGR